MDMISEIETYIAEHTALDGPDARDVIRRFSLGENVELPAAITTAGVDVRNAIVAALGAAPAVTEPAAALPAPAASSPSSGNVTTEQRRVVLEAIAPEPAFAATVAFLAGSDMPIDEAAKTLRIAKEASAAITATGLPAGYLTIAERAADMPEFGPMTSMPMLDAASRKEAVKAGWSKAMKAAQGPGATLHIGAR